MFWRLYDGLVYENNTTEDRALPLLQTIGTMVEQTERGGCCHVAWGVLGVECLFILECFIVALFVCWLRS